jgi:hypothetical protein
MANNIVLNPQAGDQFALTGVTSTYNQPNAFAQIGVTTYSTASIPAHANNALYGKALIISGFAAAGNNGTFLVLSSTATSVTVNNPNGVVVVAAGVAAFTTQSFPVQYASKVSNMWSNQTGDNVTVNANAGDCLVAIAIGMRDNDPFDLIHGASAYPGYIQSLNDYNANPTISDYANGLPVDIVATSVTANVITVNYINPSTTVPQTSYFAGSQSVLLNGTQESAVNGHTVVVATTGQVEGDVWYFTAPLTTANYSNADDTGDATPVGNTWTLAASSTIIDSDYTPVPTAPATTPYSSIPPLSGPAQGPAVESSWSADGYYPSIYIWVAPNVAAGSYKVNLNSMYQPGSASPEWSSGAQPIFDGGVNFMVFSLSGAAATTPVEAFSISTGSAGHLAETTSNPATAPATLTVANVDGDALISIGVLKQNNAIAVGSTGSSVPTSLTLTAVSPLTVPGSSGNYGSQNIGGAVYTGTITGGANNALVGNVFTVAGFVNSVNNGTFTCTASTSTTLTLTNGYAIAETHAATASYTPLMTQIGSGWLVGADAHYMVEYALVGTGTYNPGFQNPLGYAMLVASVAIKSS